MKIQLPLFFLILLSCVSCSTLKTQPSYILTTDINWARETTQNSYLGPKLFNSMSPVVVDDVVYLGNAIDGFVAIDRKSGNLLWRINIKNGVGASAIVANNVVYFGGNDGQFYALKASSGQILWTFPTQSQTLSAPFLDGSNIYFLAENGILYSLNATTGKMNWSHSQRNQASINIRSSSSPIVDGALLYIGFNDGTLAAFDKAKGFLKWERNLSVPQDRFRDTFKPVIDGDNLYMTTYSGGLFCIKKTTGEILWKNDDGGAGSVTLDGNRLYYSTSTQKIVALDKMTGKLIWSRSVKAGVGTQPVVFNELLLVGISGGSLEILNKKEGTLMEVFSPGWGISAPVSVNTKTNDVYILSNYGNVYSLNLRWLRPQLEWPWDR